MAVIVTKQKHRKMVARRRKEKRGEKETELKKAKNGNEKEEK